MEASRRSIGYRLCSQACSPSPVPRGAGPSPSTTPTHTPDSYPQRDLSNHQQPHPGLPSPTPSLSIQF